MEENINPNKRKILEYVNANSLANCFSFKSEASKERWKKVLKTELKPTEIEDGKIKVQMCTGCIIIGALFFSIVDQLITDKKINPDNITKKNITTMVGVMDTISKNLEVETGNRIPNLWKCRRNGCCKFILFA